MNQYSYKDWRYAYVAYNGLAYGMRTMTGWGPSTVDDRGASHFLPPDASNHDLGAALLDCLAQSRFMTDEELGPEPGKLFSKEELARNKESWKAAMLANMGMKSYPRFRKHQALLGVNVTDGILYLLPTINLNGREWRQSSDAAERDRIDIKLPYPSPPREVGAALREAFRRCEALGAVKPEVVDPRAD